MNTKYEEIHDADAFIQEYISIELPKYLRGERTNPISCKKFLTPLKLIGEIKMPLHFSQCIFYSFSFNNAKLIENLHFNNSIFENSFTINDKSIFESKLNIIQCTGQFNIYNGKFKEVEIQTNENTLNNESKIKNSKIIITGGEFERLDLNSKLAPTKSEEIRIFNDNVIGNIFISNQNNEIGRIRIRGHSEKCKISIIDVKINKLFIEKYKSEDGIRIINIKPLGDDSAIEITDSYLGKSEFSSINFTAFSDITIKDSFISNCTLINTSIHFDINGSEDENLKLKKPINKHIASIIKAVTQYEEAEYEKYSKKRDLFRQFKFLFSKNGDNILEQRVHSYEMLCLTKTLSWKDDFWTKLTIALSFITSNFGQSIKRPLVCLLVSQFILIFILLLSNNFLGYRFTFNPMSNHAESVSFLISKYIELITPLHKFETNNLIGLISVSIFRIWNSYMIYNIIRASRRFIK